MKNYNLSKIVNPPDYDAKSMTLEQKVKKLDGLFQRAVEQMTNEKLDKFDYHILSSLIQQGIDHVKI